MGDPGNTRDKVIIVGGGFGALSASLALHKVGINSIVLERAHQMRQEGFAIGAFTNVWRALDELGVGDAVREGHLALQGVQLMEYTGEVIKRIDLKDVPPPPHQSSHELRAVQREAIPGALTAQLPPGTVHYSSNVVGVTATDTGAEVELEGGRKLPCRFAVLADGVHSKTATNFHKAELKYMNCAAWRGQVDLRCEEGIEEPRSAIVQAPNIRVGIIPMKYNLAAKTATWFWFLAMAVDQKEDMGSQEEQKKRIMELIKDWKVDIVQQVLGQTPLDGFWFSHIYERQVVPGQPWFSGCMTAVGDAAHATTPFLAQGGAMALEDGVELGCFLKKAMQEAGVPFSQLPPAAIVSTLRKFETKRSSRVYQIIRKSSLSMRFSMERNFLIGLLVRWVAPYLIRPSFIFGHTIWEPSGSLTRVDVHKG